MIETNLILGILFVVWVMQIATTKQLRKMKRLERMFSQYEKSGFDVLEFCRKKGIHRSKFYYWKQKHEKQKEAGLIDRRRGISYKATKDRRKFVLELKIKNPLLSSKDIAIKFEKKFRIKITPRHISRIIRAENLNDSVGRKTGKPVKKKLQSD